MESPAVVGDSPVFENRSVVLRLRKVERDNVLFDELSISTATAELPKRLLILRLAR